MKEKSTKNYKSLIVGDRKRRPLSAIKANSTKRPYKRSAGCGGCSRKRRTGG